MIDSFASATHYVDHLAPIWNTLEDRGTFWAGSDRVAQHARHRGVPDPRVGRPDGQRPVMVAAHRDELAVDGPIILVEHGAGQHYGGHDASGAGAQRPRIILYLGPNQATCDRMAAVAPQAVRVPVGCPKLDAWHGWQPTVPDGLPTVGLTWHWPARTWPEAGWAWPTFRRSVPAVAARWPTIGHGHPRVFGHLIGDYRRAGITPEHDATTFLSRIQLLVADNTSLIFEAAAIGLPVVLLDSPTYRRGVEHGLRFWEWANIGPRTRDPAALVDVIAEGWARRDDYRPVREQMRAAVYGRWDGQASQRAAETIAACCG